MWSVQNRNGRVCAVFFFRASFIFYSQSKCDFPLKVIRMLPLAVCQNQDFNTPLPVSCLPTTDEHYGITSHIKFLSSLVVRFVDKCLVEMLRVCQNLETVLGPGTSDLRARVGLHSGPVTAGTSCPE